MKTLGLEGGWGGEEGCVCVKLHSTGDLLLDSTENCTNSYIHRAYVHGTFTKWGPASWLNFLKSPSKKEKKKKIFRSTLKSTCIVRKLRRWCECACLCVRGWCVCVCGGGG